MKNQCISGLLRTSALQSAKALFVFLLLTGLSGCHLIPELEDLLEDQSDNVYKVKLNALNSSGVSGYATLTLEDGYLTVEIEAKGLEPNQPHAQHIHGLENRHENATCPTLAADTNGNGLVEIGEGLPFYGGVLLPLEPFSTAPDGTIDYEQTFKLGEGGIISAEELKPLHNRVIVLHGLTVSGEYVASLPVACGEIMMP